MITLHTTVYILAAWLKRYWWYIPNVAVINPKLRIRSTRHMCGNFVYHRLSEDSMVRIIIYGIHLTSRLRPPHRTYYHFIYCDSLSRCRRRPNVRVINPTSKTQGVHCTYVSYVNPETSFRSVWIPSRTFTRCASGLRTDRILNGVNMSTCSPSEDLIGILRPICTADKMNQECISCIPPT